MTDNPLTPIGMAIQAEAEHHQNDAHSYQLPRRAGKSSLINRLLNEHLRSHPGAKAAHVSINQHGQLVVRITQAAGELVKDPADNVYRPKKEITR